MKTMKAVDYLLIILDIDILFNSIVILYKLLIWDSLITVYCD